MRALFVAALLFSTIAAAQPPANIFDRLQHAFANPTEGSRAVSDLRAQNFAAVTQMLEHERRTAAAKSGDLLAIQGAVEFLAGEMTNAVADLTAAEHFTPLSGADRFTLAMALVNLGDDNRARQQLEQLARNYSNRALYLYWLGRLDYDQRRYQEAVAKLTRAVELDPEAARAWDSLGLAFDMQGQMDQALGAFEKATALNRKQPHPSPWPPHNLGFLLLRMNRANDAVDALEESLRYDSSLAIANYHLGRALEKLGRTQDAIRYYQQAVARDPKSTDACYSLANLYRKLQREPEAEQMFAEYRRRRAAQQ